MMPGQGVSPPGRKARTSKSDWLYTSQKATTWASRATTRPTSNADVHSPNIRSYVRSYRRPMRAATSVASQTANSEVRGPAGNATEPS